MKTPDDVNYVDFKIAFPEFKFILTPSPGFEIHLAHMPNWWWRFWQFVLLGWRWRKQ